MSEIKAALIGEPFLIKEEPAAILLARYMVEDNEEDYLMLDLNKSGPMAVVRSIFRKLMENYKILDVPTEIKLAGEISKIFHRYQEPLSNQFQALPASKDGFLSLQLLLETLTAFEIILAPEHIDYLTLRLFEVSPSLKRFEFKKIFELFPHDEHLRNKMIEDSRNQHRQHHINLIGETHSDYLSETLHSPKDINFENPTPKNQSSGVNS